MYLMLSQGLLFIGIYEKEENFDLCRILGK